LIEDDTNPVQSEGSFVDCSAATSELVVFCDGLTTGTIVELPDNNPPDYANTNCVQNGVTLSGNKCP